ncbi:MAG: A24 family peptidase [Chloroflexi bacterium]|nr:A24 family peptidase [Chloroflexota bacterium]
MSHLLTLIPAWPAIITIPTYAVMTWVLLPCALQDYRTREISNWLTVPLFFLAWPAAIYLNTLTLTFATFLGFWLAFKLGSGMGPADGKIAVAVAALTPLGLLAGIAVSGLVFLWQRLRRRPPVSIPGAVTFYAGVVISFLLLVSDKLI